MKKFATLLLCGLLAVGMPGCKESKKEKTAKKISMKKKSNKVYAHPTKELADERAFAYPESDQTRTIVYPES